MGYEEMRINSMSFTIDSLLALIQKSGSPELTCGASQILDCHLKQEKDNYQRYVNNVLKGKGPIQILREKMGISKWGSGVDLLARGDDRRYPAIGDVRKLIWESLSPDVCGDFYGTWQPFSRENDFTSLPSNPEEFETRIYRANLPPGRDRYHLSVGVTDGNLKSWCLWTLDDTVPYSCSVTLYTWHPVEMEWLTHENTQLHPMAKYRNGFFSLMKRYGHNPHTHQMPERSFNVLLEKIKGKVFDDFSIGPYRVSINDSKGVFTHKKIPVKWSEIPAETQHAIILELKGR